jgi:hypothetical protein
VSVRVDDCGVVQGMAQRFTPAARATHAPGCRNKGGGGCTSVVTFKPSWGGCAARLKRAFPPLTDIHVKMARLYV